MSSIDRLRADRVAKRHWAGIVRGNKTRTFRLFQCLQVGIAEKRHEAVHGIGLEGHIEHHLLEPSQVSRIVPERGNELFAASELDRQGVAENLMSP